MKKVDVSRKKFPCKRAVQTFDFLEERRLLNTEPFGKVIVRTGGHKGQLNLIRSFQSVNDFMRMKSLTD